MRGSLAIRTTHESASGLVTAHTISREARATRATSITPERLATIRVPVLMLLGTQSPPFLQDATQRIVQSLPNASVAPLEGQNHVAIDAAPELLLERVLPTLAHG